MLVYIDESGDAGFKVDQGSSPVFVAAMVIFGDAGDAAFTRDLIKGSAARQLHTAATSLRRPELAFCTCAVL